MTHIKLPVFDESGYVIVDSYNQNGDPREWENLVFVDWKSSGETRFAPLASAYGDMECDGFWNHTPPKTDKDGVWVQENVDIAPILTVADHWNICNRCVESIPKAWQFNQVD